MNTLPLQNWKNCFARAHIKAILFRQRCCQRDRAEQGQGLVEYALILVLVALVVIVILSFLGPLLYSRYGFVACVLETRDVDYCIEYFETHTK